jgi:N-acetylneuraminate synthase
MKNIMIGNRLVGNGEPVYNIAEIGSNFDGSIERAKKLIDLAKDCGADAAKFQCFKAEKIVSKEGFKNLKMSFQSKWKKPVYDVYKDAEFPREWTEELFSYANKKGLHFLSAPYDKDAVDILEDIGVPAFKIGSGDITWPYILKYIARKEKPIILGTGASTLEEVDRAVNVIKSTGNNDIILLQCVTNYPSSFDSANIRAMQAMGNIFDVLVGCSDHTSGFVVPLGAVSLGACVIEKHFTDDKNRIGPDHPFAMDGVDFKLMVENIRRLERSLGSPYKNLYAEENETVILQRRSLRASKNIKKGTFVTEDMIEVLRPAPKEAIGPAFYKLVLGRIAKEDIKKGDPFTWSKI